MLADGVGRCVCACPCCWRAAAVAIGSSGSRRRTVRPGIRTHSPIKHANGHGPPLHDVLLASASEPLTEAPPMLATGLTRDFPRSSDRIHTRTERYDAVLSCTAPTTQHGGLCGRAVLHLPLSTKRCAAARRTATRAHHGLARLQGERRARSPHHPSSLQRAREPARARGGLHRPCLALTRHKTP